MSLQQVRHSFARQLRKQRYSLQEIGKLLGHKAGSSMTIMYADMADDEVVDSGKAYLLLLKMCKKVKSRQFSTSDGLPAGKRQVS